MNEKQKHEELSMNTFVYAEDYVRIFNKRPDELNHKYMEQGLGNYLQLKRLNVLVWPDEDLVSDSHSVTVLGTYIGEYKETNDSIIGVIKINLKAHKGDFEKIKETVRHEIAHAISHQICGVKNNHHNGKWMEIAKQHEVNIDRYRIEL